MPLPLSRVRPMTPATHEVTHLLLDWRAGDQTALARLLPAPAFHSHAHTFMLPRAQAHRVLRADIAAPDSAALSSGRRARTPA